MRRYLPGFLALLLAIPACQAGEPPKDKATTPEQQYKKLVQDFNKQVQDYFQAFAKAKTPEERAKLQKEKHLPDRSEYASKMLKLAEDNPTSAAAPDALAWVVMNTMPSSTDAKKAMAVLVKDHIKSKAIGQIVPVLGFRPSAANIATLQQIIKENPEHDVQGQATFTLAQNLAHEHKDKEAAKAFEKVVKDYGDVKGPQGKLGDTAKSELYELQHLAVGMAAPNITGEDADGKKFQLSDYRGKVVLLDFWAEW